MPRKLSPDLTYATIALHGFSGVGKTTVAATAPGPVIILNKDNGLSSLLHLPQFKDVEQEDIKDVAHFERCLKNLRGIGKRDWSKKFKTVIVDDAPSIQAMIMEELQEQAAAKDDRFELDESTQRMYGVMGSKLSRWVRSIKMIPMHRILVCSSVTAKDDGMLIPGLIGAMKFKLPHMTDALIYMRMAKGNSGDRVLCLEGTDEYLAKTRYHWMPKKIVIKSGNRSGTMTQLIKMIPQGPKAK